MKPALSQVCTLNSSFESDIVEFAAGHCEAVEVWFGKLESYLAQHSIDDARRLLDEYHMSVPVAAFQGGLLASQGDFRREHWEHFGKRLDLCRQLGIGTILIAADVAGPIDAVTIERVQVSLRQAAEAAAERDVRLALEFQARSALANNLETAASLVAQCDHPLLGICLDVFHYYTGPSKFEDLGYLSSANLFHVQLCDLAGVARELAADSDRILPGDGDFALGPIVDRLRAIDYDGYVSVELMNPTIWQVPPRQFGEIGMTALRKALGLASMD